MASGERQKSFVSRETARTGSDRIWLAGAALCAEEGKFEGRLDGAARDGRRAGGGAQHREPSGAALTKARGDRINSFIQPNTKNMAGASTAGTPSKKPTQKRRALEKQRVNLHAIVFLFVVTVTCLFVSEKVYSTKHSRDKRSTVPSRAVVHAGARTHPRADADADAELQGSRESRPHEERDEGKASPLKESSPREHHMNSRLAAQARPLGAVREAFVAQAWRSCAVVGNSGNALLGKGHGARIDAHDAVIRLNLAPLEGHREDLGQATTVSFVNGWKLHSCASAEGACACWDHYREGKDVFVVAYPIEAEHMKDGEGCKRANSDKFHLVTDGFKTFSNDIVYHYASERIKRNFPQEMWAQLAEERRKVKLHYSSGFQAVLFAASLCEEVSLFGFGKGVGEGAGAPGETDQHHYFESETLHEIEDHDYEAEMIFYKELESRTAPRTNLFSVQRLKIYN